MKPLGPRRLARLQRELAERAREVEASGGGAADPELLEKQRRFAELAAQAEAGQADSGAAMREPVAPAPAPSPPAPPPAGPPAAEPPQERLEQITVVFPGGSGAGGPDGHVSHDPVHVDPALFSNRLAPEDLAALTHIEIVPSGRAEHLGSHTAAPVPDHGAGEAAGSGAAAAPPPVADADTPGEADDPPGAAAGTSDPSAVPAGAGPETEEEPPAPPVPAGTAQGLELLEPREYRRRSGAARWVLLLAVLAALAVVLVLFVL
ncbi:hypothetical protein QYM41_10840 [Kocuria sp. CPCC 205268]|uniref:hypothetical protein n=1 Tax=Kocuria oxytropis TaxID=3058913 RepID=UPI0034D3F560